MIFISNLLTVYTSLIKFKPRINFLNLFFLSLHLKLLKTQYNMKYFFTILALVLFSGLILAQNTNTNGKRKCGFDEVQQWRLQNEPGYAEAYQKLEAFTAKFIAEHPNGYSPKAVITIPVVFHIVLSPAQHATFLDARCTEQIAVMNQDYAGLNTHSIGTFNASLKCNTDLQFCMATISPTGAATNGIERRDYTGAQWGTDPGVKHNADGGLDSWPTTDYLNIWVCDLGAGLCGYALTPAGAASNPEFGLVNHYEYTGVTGASPPYDLGGTGTHESGHCFNLKHIWADAGGCTPDDLAADTPPQDVETYGNPTFPVTDICSATSPGIMYMNFMDYVDDIAYANFTPDQKTRIQACFAPGGDLEQLGYSTKCGIPLVCDFVGNPCVPATVNMGGQVDFTDLTTGSPTTWKWTFTGGTPASSTVQNPQNVVYSTPGLYPVKLKVTKPNFADSLTKIDYIEVIDPLAVAADFVGVPTLVPAGTSVDFTDLSTNTPTSWQWSFPGGTPATSVVKNPQNIVYNTPGVYNVWLKATKTTANYDTITKLGYIIVFDPDSIPIAKFIANQTNIPVGTSINYINLTTGVYDSAHWYFPGSVQGQSTAINPTGITYNTPGDYDASLYVMGSYGNNDTLRPMYIHVYDPAVPADSVFADFQAITGRLIVQGSAVSFEDLSEGNITNWNWIFQGSTNSTAQNPQNVVYSTPGIFDVCLIVSNGTYSDTACKEDYIVVTTEPWPNPNGFCDTVTNQAANEHPLNFMHLTPNKWGYLPGHNEYLIKYYAEKYINYTFTNVSGLIVAPVKAYSSSPLNKVRFTVWDMDSLGLPKTSLGYKDVLISSFAPPYYYPVLFDTPIPVDGKFFIGFQIWYNTPVDTFVVYMVPNRGADHLNTLYLKKGANWITPTKLFNDTMIVNTSMAIKLIGCLVGTEEIDMESQVVVYPNPTSDKINVELFDVVLNKFNCKMFDITGRSVAIDPYETRANHYEFDLTSVKNGIYLLQISVNNQTITKKVSVVH